MKKVMEKRNLVPLFHSEEEEEEGLELFTETHMSPEYFRSLIPQSNATIGRATITSETNERSGVSSRLYRQAPLNAISEGSPKLTDEKEFPLDGDKDLGLIDMGHKLSLTPTSELSSKRDSIEIDKPLDQVDWTSLSGIQSREKDILTKLIDDRLRKMFSPEPKISKDVEGECHSIFSKDSVDFSDLKKDDWNDFVLNMAAKLGIRCSNADKKDEEKSYMSSRLLPPKETEIVDIPLEGSIIRALKEVDNEWTTRQKVQCYTTKDRKKYSVTQDHLEAFCTPPVLDKNIEEGIMHSKKSSSTYAFSSKTAETTNNCLRKLDNSARLLLRQISYGALITSYLDDLESEDGRQEAIKNLSDLFLSMADVTARIAVSSVAARRSLYLKDMEFKNKATEDKLLNMSALGPNIFGGKFFDILHGSAENMRNARETQCVRFRTPSTFKRGRDSSNEKGENYQQQEQKRLRSDASGPFRGKKTSQSTQQRARPESRKPRFQRGGSSFRPSSQ